VRGTLSRLTGAPFEISNLSPDDPLLKVNPVWFVWCPDAYYLKSMAHAQRAWRDDKGIVLESAVLGDTIDWIELVYGDEEAGKSLNIDYSNFSSNEFREEFGSKFPLVYERIQRYEAITATISKEKHIYLEVRSIGSKGMLVFTLAAKIAGEDVEKSLKEKIEVNAEALKEAYREIVQS